MIACRHDSRLVQHEVIASIKDKMRRYAFCEAENPLNCRVYSTIPVPGHFQQTTSGEGFPPRSIARKINMNIEYLDFLKVSTVVTRHSLVPHLVNMFGTFSKHHSEEYLGLSWLHIDHGYMALQCTADVAIPCTTLDVENHQNKQHNFLHPSWCYLPGR